MHGLALALLLMTANAPAAGTRAGAATASLVLSVTAPRTLHEGRSSNVWLTIKNAGTAAVTLALWPEADFSFTSLTQARGNGTGHGAPVHGWCMPKSEQHGLAAGGTLRIIAKVVPLIHGKADLKVRLSLHLVDAEGNCVEPEQTLEATTRAIIAKHK